MTLAGSRVRTHRHASAQKFCKVYLSELPYVRAIG